MKPQDLKNDSNLTDEEVEEGEIKHARTVKNFDIDNLPTSKHQRAIHNHAEDANETLVVNSKNEIVGADTGDAVHNCKACGKAFLNEISMRAHFAKAHGIKKSDNQKIFQGQVLARLDEILTNIRNNRSI